MSMEMPRMCLTITSHTFCILQYNIHCFIEWQPVNGCASCSICVFRNLIDIIAMVVVFWGWGWIKNIWYI